MTKLAKIEGVVLEKRYVESSGVVRFLICNKKTSARHLLYANENKDFVSYITMYDYIECKCKGEEITSATVIKNLLLDKNEIWN